MTGRIYDIRVCAFCGEEFERKSRAPQIYCSPVCRREKNKKVDRQLSHEWHKRNPVGNILRNLKYRAAKRGLEFNLTPDDIIFPECCPVFGFPLRMNFGRNGGAPDSPSIDRIDNSKGYVKGNIQVISNLANAMKSSANREQLLQFADWINKEYR